MLLPGPACRRTRLSRRYILARGLSIVSLSPMLIRLELSRFHDLSAATVVLNRRAIDDRVSPRFTL
jgi:hypothetical protein